MVACSLVLQSNRARAPSDPHLTVARVSGGNRRCIDACARCPLVVASWSRSIGYSERSRLASPFPFLPFRDSCQAQRSGSPFLPLPIPQIQSSRRRGGDSAAVFRCSEEGTACAAWREGLSGQARIGAATGAIRLHPQHTAVGGGRRCSAGDAGEKGRHARLRRVVRAEEQNHLARWRRAESQVSSSRSHFVYACQIS